MLQVSQISQKFGIQIVLDKISFNINPSEHWGLVGANGCGKTTLLRILNGELRPDQGSVQFNPPDLQVGYLPQGFPMLTDDTIGSFIDRQTGDFDRLNFRLEELAGQLALFPTRQDLQVEFNRILAEIESRSSGDIQSTLAVLGLSEFPPETPVANLSGGQKTRLALAGVLATRPQLLLLDEPTNHLDIGMLEWLEAWLNNFRGGVLLVSHDRTFLDNTVTGIFELNSHTHQLKAYAGNYSVYLNQKISEHEKQRQDYADQQVEIARLQSAATSMRQKARFHKGGKADPKNTDRFSPAFFADRSKGTIQKAKNIEKRIDKLRNEDHINKPARTWQMRIEFGEIASSGRDVFMLENCTVGYPTLPLLENLNLTLRFGTRTALIGQNGCGKTTLLRTLTGKLPPLSGSVRLGANVQIGFMSQEQEELDPISTPLETILKISGHDETQVRSFLSLFLFKGDEVFTPNANLSYGERARLILAGLVAQGCNFLLLDEPINHLDIPARTSFEQALRSFEGTIMVVVHDRYFIRSFANQIWEVKNGQILTRDNEKKGIQPV